MTDDEPTLRRIPSALWIRLRAALGSLIVERDGGGIQWRNRTFQTIAERRYSAPPAERHTLILLMAQYFGDIVAMPIITGRGICRHPIAFHHPLNQPHSHGPNASNPDHDHALGLPLLTSPEGNVWLAANDDWDIIDVRRLEEVGVSLQHVQSCNLHSLTFLLNANNLHFHHMTGVRPSQKQRTPAGSRTGTLQSRGS